MQRSSECIANLAAALAKAQIELINPEKSLIGIISSDGIKQAERAFRYAPLSSGLDIVRKVLGHYEIATVQTTSVDQTAGIINLTTVLAHASGEWIASDWPVCPVSETANPHRMGAALTYARRYALFTLVGIAGEDDVDAPDLITPAAAGSGKDLEQTNGESRLNGGNQASTRRAPARRDRKLQPFKQVLDGEGSADLRDRLLNEIRSLLSCDDAGLWAHRSLAKKNTLIAADSRQVEEAFDTRISTLAAPTTPTADARVGKARGKSSKAKTGQNRSAAIDKSALALPEPRRVRDREHVKFVATRPCLICGRQPADAHHLRFMQSRALGRKVSDEFTVPLCRGHHREAHRYADEPTWWLKLGIDPALSARTLWLETHPLPKQHQALPVSGQDDAGKPAELQNQVSSAAAG